MGERGVKVYIGFPRPKAINFGFRFHKIHQIALSVRDDFLCDILI